MRPAARQEPQMPAPGVPGRPRISEQPVLKTRHAEQQQTQPGQYQDGNGNHAAGPPPLWTTPCGYPGVRR
ncbi:hypothetical protein EZV63_33870 [Streptomyces sp. VN1]|nr:hypothetical protein EZV63_33870 [Streptomyces sp. VN1]